MKWEKIFIAALCMALSAYFTPAFAKEKVIFGGGPAGGTFQLIANAIHNFKPVKDAAGFKFQVQSSEGSIENMKKIDAGGMQMGIVYSGDLWMGTNSRISSDPSDGSEADTPESYNKVMAVSYLYSAPAQLVVHTGSAIKSVKDLEGKKVGVGNIGSGAYSTSRLFFTHIGIWDKIEKRNIGYNDAARAFRNSELDAFWVFTALPSPAVTLAAEDRGVDIINIGESAQESDFFKTFPWFSTVMIQPGAYKGVSQDTLSFQDSAIWVASAEVSAEVVYQMLSIIYTDEGLKHLAEQNDNLKGISVATGIIGIVTPLHPGAEKFWMEKSVVK